MGAADVVPGVSGGTMALILGIYQKLINAIKSFDLIWFKSILVLNLKTVVSRPHFKFLIPLLLGIFIAILFFTRVVPLPILIKTHPAQVYGLFFGLILASILILIRHLDSTRTIHYLYLLAGTLFGYMIFTIVPAETPDTSLFIFVSGALAICAMILPGISGSFILLILNKYAYVLDAIGHFKLAVLIPFALGAASGLLLFSRFLSWLLEKYYKQTLLFIIGLLTASLWAIWPFQVRVFVTMGDKEKLLQSVPYVPSALNTEVYQSIALMLFGFFLVVAFDIIERRQKNTRA